MPSVIERYTFPEMARIWSEQHKLEVWKEVETLALEAWNRLGKVPQGVVEATRAAACPTPEQVAEREQVTNHDLAAFVDLLGEFAGPDAAGWVHYGLTSSDVVDTAGGVILSESADLLLTALEALFDTVRDRALDHRDTYMVGRTHGIWAEPTTFGLKVAGWAFELARDHARLQDARSTVGVEKIGCRRHLRPRPAGGRETCLRFPGTEAEPASTQVIARDRHAQYLQTIALIGASIERMATEIRHLHRSEVAEVREAFGKGQKGSSAMPHKRNPILSERMTGMARLLRGYAQVGLENVALWHERDISHSSAERVVLPDVSIALHYMVVKFAGLVRDLVVDADRMKANLESTRGLVFSQAALLAMIDKGMTRDQAYRIVQGHAMTAWDKGQSLEALMAADPAVELTDDQLAACFSLERVGQSAGIVFARLDDLKL